MARMMRDRKVPTEQIDLFLGHLPKGHAATTAIYAPFGPEHCAEAVTAIEDVLSEIRKNLRRHSLDRPSEPFLQRKTSKGGVHLTPGVVEAISQKIAAGISPRKLARDFRVSLTTVNRRKRAMSHSEGTVRNTGRRLTEVERKEIDKLLDDGITAYQIAKLYGVTRNRDLQPEKA